MKKIFLSIITFIGLAVVCNLLLTSCGGGDDDGRSSGVEITPYIYSMNLTVEPSGYSETISLSDLKTDIVSAISSENWVTLTRQSYTDGSPAIKVEVSENTSVYSRKCRVTITSSDGNKVIIYITQKEKMPQKIDKLTDQPALTKRIN